MIMLTKKRVLQIASDVTDDVATFEQLKAYVTVWAMENNIITDTKPWDDLIREIVTVLSEELPEEEIDYEDIDYRLSELVC